MATAEERTVPLLRRRSHDQRVPWIAVLKVRHFGKHIVRQIVQMVVIADRHDHVGHAVFHRK